MLILNQTRTLEALEKTYINDNWLTIVFVLLLFAVFVLKVLNPQKLKGYTFALFTKNFVEDEIEEDTSFLSGFQITIYLFSGIVLSIVLFFLATYYSVQISKDFFSFLMIFLIITSYFMLKWAIEYLLSEIFQVKKTIRFFKVSKFSYLYSTCFFLFIGSVLVQYSQLEVDFLLYFSILLFLIRFIIHFINNKKLIFSKLFYFILYLCAFEIAPLLILFKLMF